MANVNTTQIADRLHLSRNTVSKALNNSPEVSDKTKELVISTAIKMGYKKLKSVDYAAIAQAQTSNDVCLLVHEREIPNQFWNRLLKGAEEYFTARHYRIVLGLLNRADEERGELPLVLREGRVSGVIVIGMYTEAYYRLIQASGIPAVTIDTAPAVRDNSLISDTVLMCNESSVYEITEHLIKSGVRDIAYVGDASLCRSNRERWLGYTAAMRDHGVPVNPLYDRLQRFDPELDGYADIVEEVRRLEVLPRAMVCANDPLAKVMRRTIRERGLRVPEDVAISGFDNFDNGIAEDNTLTSVAFDIEELGTMAARQLLYRIHHPQASLVLIRLESHPIFRRSTEVPR